MIEMDRRFDRLPPLMRSAIQTLQDLHNTPDALAMPAVLGIVNLAVMPHHKIDSILFGEIPLSLYILCMLPTGMRKSTNYNEVSVGIERFETRMWDNLKEESIRVKIDTSMFQKALKQYEKDMESHANAVQIPGNPTMAPVPPTEVRPRETANYRLKKATLNGIIDQLRGQPFVGLFSAEAGEMFNSHSFQGGRDQSRSIEMSAALTSMWDGTVIERQTGIQDNNVRLHNRAVNMMFFLQEETIRDFLNNPMYSSQGFVHRILITQAERTQDPAVNLTPAGQRQIARIRSQLDPFHDHIEHLISQRMHLLADRHFELDRHTITILPEAAEVFELYINANQDRAQRDLRNWAGFAERLYEHALRIAGTLTAFEQRMTVDQNTALAAVDLMDYFTEQRVNLEMGISTRNPQQATATRRLLEWMQQRSFSGTKREITQSVRWFRELTADERDAILEELVRDGLVLATSVVAKNGREKTVYSVAQPD
jgi:DNA-binding PadR family transcriptional regulator